MMKTPALCWMDTDNRLNKLDAITSNALQGKLGSYLREKSTNPKPSLHSEVYRLA